MNQLSSASRTAYANLFTGTSDSTPLDSTPLDATPINSTPLASPDIFQKIKNNPHELCGLGGILRAFEPRIDIHIHIVTGLGI
ncbi:hypothetical protein QS308_10465 [Paraburkholderia bonniea]|uniref:hypothetical protein n=1 Tax=Paraburkholderia bonniea TaxID=2152891 RepID=UPI002572882E|nr:hypothetical protein [Paraburkholderia bonniea]WJF92846.1 hypothetical protein QS308_10465 [Paraburkholderia bonniea]